MNIGILESKRILSNEIIIDISNYSFVTGQSFVTTSKDNLPIDVFVTNDGLKLFYLGFTSKKVYQYSFGIAYDLTTLNYVSEFATSLTSPTSFSFNTDGTRLYIYDNLIPAARDIFQYSLSSAFNISSATYVSRSHILSTSTIGLFINPLGTKTFTTDISNKKISSQILSTAFDITTATNSLVVGIPECVTPEGLCFSSSGKSVVIVDSSNTTIKQYNLSIAYDLSSLVFSGKTLSVSGQQTELRSLCFSKNDSIIFLVGSGGDKITKHVLI
jgi:hypothetical protein